jgi:hypothetical protein
VASEGLSSSERGLDVDLVALGQAREVRAVEGLADGVEGEAAVLDLDHGQAEAVERHGVAGLSACGGLRRLDLDAEAVPVALDSGNPASFAHDAREHASKATEVRLSRFWHARVTHACAFPP